MRPVPSTLLETIALARPARPAPADVLAREMDDCLDPFEPGRVDRPGLRIPGDLSVALGRAPGERQHVVACVPEHGNESRADEPGGTGDRNLHLRSCTWFGERRIRTWTNRCRALAS